MKISLVLSLLMLSFIGAFAQKQPNLVFILTDDQSYELLGCNGNKLVKTPNIDQLAEDGVRFTNAYVTSAICTPSRVSIFLSQYERKHGINFNSGTSVAPEAWAQSYPVLLRQHGYYTGYIGKNHSPVGIGGYSSGLMESSFDYWFAAHRHLGFYPKQRHKENFKGAQHHTQIEIINEGARDFIGNEHRLEGAKHFIDNRPEEQPFCLSICFNLPHDNSTMSMRQLESDSVIYRDLYRDIDIPMPDNYIARGDIQHPKLPKDLLHAEDRQTSYNYVDEPATNKERIIRRMQTVTGIDGLVGDLLKTLKQKKLYKNTIIIFTSDHGLFMGQQGLGGKALCYQEVTRVPMIVYSPFLKKKQRGFVSNELVQTIDIAPTMLSYANVPIPEAFQGKDISGIVDGTKAKVRDFVFTENLWSTPFGNPRCEAIQDKDWKYIRYYKNENASATKLLKIANDYGIKKANLMFKISDAGFVTYRQYIEGPLEGEAPVYEELYNLNNDPEELNNLIGDKKYKAELQRLKEAWEEAIKTARGTGKAKVVREMVEAVQKR